MSQVFKCLGWVWFLMAYAFAFFGKSSGAVPFGVMVLALLSLILAEVMGWRRGERP